MKRGSGDRYKAETKKGFWGSILICGYCEGKLTIEQPTSVRCVPWQKETRPKPPPGAREMVVIHTSGEERVAIAGRAKCSKCGAYYREYETEIMYHESGSPPSGTGKFEADWETVTREEYDDDNRPHRR